MDVAAQLLKEKTQNVSVLPDDSEEYSDKEKVTAIDFKMITFSLAGKDYAIDIMKVKEIAKAGRFTYVPNTLPFVIGVYNLRGDIIPIIDFRIFFNIDVPERKDDELESLLIITVGEQSFGTVVDEIHSVVGIQKDTIQPPHPLFGDISIRYISGVVESSKHLYILLDVDRIFSGKIEASAGKKSKPVLVQPSAAVAKNIVSQAKAVPAKADTTAADSQREKDYNFIVNDLRQFEQFYVSGINESWVKFRFDEWMKARSGKSAQLQTKETADEFIKPFWSKNSNTWWSKSFADAVYKILPENTAKQILVWNIGCGKGYETYSLCCLLKKRYPESKIRIYAHDKDLLDVSNAPLLSIEQNFANDWYAPYVTHKANGEYTFTQEIKDAIMFEYHDCSNTNAVPMADIVFARDVISLMPPDTQNSIVSDIAEKIKGNGIFVVGENESLSGYPEWQDKGHDLLSVYGK